MTRYIDEMPTADVMSIEEAAELLGRLDSTPCEHTGNEWLHEICEHKDACADTSSKDCWLQYLKYRKRCNDFETKTDWVEVVRCKDCKYRGESDCPMYHEELEDYDDGDYVYTDLVAYDNTVDDGFCYCGERIDE